MPRFIDKRSDEHRVLWTRQAPRHGFRGGQLPDCSLFVDCSVLSYCLQIQSRRPVFLFVRNFQADAGYASEYSWVPLSRTISEAKTMVSGVAGEVREVLQLKAYRSLVFHTQRPRSVKTCPSMQSTLEQVVAAPNRREH